MFTPSLRCYAQNPRYKKNGLLSVLWASTLQSPFMAAKDAVLMQKYACEKLFSAHNTYNIRTR